MHVKHLPHCLLCISPNKMLPLSQLVYVEGPLQHCALPYNGCWMHLISLLDKELFEER